MLPSVVLVGIGPVVRFVLSQFAKKVGKFGPPAIWTVEGHDPDTYPNGAQKPSADPLSPAAPLPGGFAGGDQSNGPGTVGGAFLSSNGMDP